MGVDLKPNRPTKDTSMTTNAGTTKAPKTQTRKPAKVAKAVKSATSSFPAQEGSKVTTPTAETIPPPAEKPATKAAEGANTPKAVKVPKARNQPKAPKEPADRLPTTLDELKASKGGLVCYLFFTGKGREEIAMELAAAFKLTDVQAAKITRRITGRARLFKRVFELMAAK